MNGGGLHTYTPVFPSSNAIRSIVELVASVSLFKVVSHSTDFLLVTANLSLEMAGLRSVGGSIIHWLSRG